MVMSTGPGGLNLASLAGAAGAETSRRVNAGENFLNSALASMLQQNQGRLLSDSEQQVREQNFARAQALIDEALARRMQDADAAQARRMAASSGGGGGNGRDPALDLQMDMLMEDYKTKQDISQSETLMDYQDRIDQRKSARSAAAEKAANTYKESDFGPLAISSLRGQAATAERPKGSRGTPWVVSVMTNPSYYLSTDERDALTDLVANHGSDANHLYAMIRNDKHFKGSAGARKASIGLYDLGYGLQPADLGPRP